MLAELFDYSEEEKEMAKFCPGCGKPLLEGEVCSCTRGTSGINLGSAGTVLESMKNRMGIGNPELNKGDAFESNKLNTPDCIKSNEGEIPVKQYTVATLRNRILGIPYTKAIGKLQVTNKRIIFRAPGRCLAGRTTLQQELAIDEVTGLEARREYVFNMWDLLSGIIVFILGGVIVNALINAMFSELSYGEGVVGAVIVTLLASGACCVPFFMVKNRWITKLLCLGGAWLPLQSVGRTLVLRGVYVDDASGFFGGFLMVLCFVVLIMALFTLFVHAIKPNLVLCIKARAGDAGINIKRKKAALNSLAKDDDYTGYTEIIPTDDSERCIREINAMINDIQKFGDYGIEKWKA